ncbi:MAG: phytanoyl-CoA dioxygenase family protein [Iphinoe sp. HA4291-MV1]|jgi:hypothetical protein|nr:phytanoyl-CoA dioxygenase family protein [Iphinoe sp. HA4291-MV1]
MFNSMINKISQLKSELSYRAAFVNHARKLPALKESDRVIVDSLKRDGVYVTTLEKLELGSTSGLLQASYNQLSRITGGNNSHLTKRLPQIYTVTDLPAFSQWGREQKLLNIIENYIGLPVAFHGVHLRKDLPNENQFGTLLWHKDSEDRRMVKIIIYLSDVEEKHGPFEYVPVSSTSLYSLNYYRIYYKLWRSGYLGITDEQLQEVIPQHKWKSCPGPAGTVIFTDPKTTLHHGTLRTEERPALFFAYTANPPKRPELCTQYWDDTFAKPELYQEPDSVTLLR